MRSSAPHPPIIPNIITESAFVLEFEAFGSSAIFKYDKVVTYPTLSKCLISLKVGLLFVE